MRQLAICGKSHILEMVEIIKTKLKRMVSKKVKNEREVANFIADRARKGLMRKFKTKKALSEHFRALALKRWQKGSKNAT